jgi:FimV-like protein
MKLCVFTFWSSDGPTYLIENEETHEPVVDVAFSSEGEARAYLQAHKNEIVRETEARRRTPLSPEESANLWNLVAHIEKGLDAGDLPVDIYGGRGKRLAKLGEQPVPLDAAASQRLNTVIARLNRLAESAALATCNTRLEENEAATKLDLARCYLEMGDKEGALFLLDEVVRRADDGFKVRARKMIADMSGQT